MADKRWNIVTIGTIFGLLVLSVGIIAYFLAGELPNPPVYSVFMGGIAIVILLVGVMYAYMVLKGKIPQEPDYRNLFIIGICWFPLGIVINMPVFWGMGFVFMAVGLINKDKWKQAKTFSQMSPMRKLFKLAMLLILGALVLITFAMWYLQTVK